MLQTVNTSGPASWPGSIVNPVVNKPEAWQRSRQEEPVPPSTGRDIALLYPEAVAVSSDAFAWQDIPLVHLRPNLNGMVVPASDSHCLGLNLTAPLEPSARC